MSTDISEIYQPALDAIERDPNNELLVVDVDGQSAGFL